jgi:hypothetical protein
VKSLRYIGVSLVIALGLGLSGCGCDGGGDRKNKLNKDIK